MKQKEELLEEQNHDRLTDCLTYLLAGLEGNTDGNELNSVAVQQASPSGYRIVIRGSGFDDDGNTVHVVGFTIADSPQRALLLAEGAYRENLIKWKIDRFAKRVSSNGSSKNEVRGLTITN